MGGRLATEPIFESVPAGAGRASGAVLAALVLTLSGCVGYAAGPGVPQRGEGAGSGGRSGMLAGVRETRGNAVDCPEILTDDGRRVAVRGLPADVALGDRVRVTGRYGFAATCRGEVLVIENLTRL